MREFLEEAGFASTDKLNFDDFHKFAVVVHKNCGFTKEEVEELSTVFDRFDINGNGDLENLELLDLFRYLGYDTSLEDVHRFLQGLNAKQDGAMDLQEFVRKMRIKREVDCASARKVFSQYSMGARKME